MIWVDLLAHLAQQQQFPTGSQIVVYSLKTLQNFLWCAHEIQSLCNRIFQLTDMGSEECLE